MKKLSLLAVVAVWIFTAEASFEQTAAGSNKSKSTSSASAVSKKSSVTSKSKVSRTHKHRSVKKTGVARDTTGVVTTSGSLSNMCIIKF